MIKINKLILIFFVFGKSFKVFKFKCFPLILVINPFFYFKYYKNKIKLLQALFEVKIKNLLNLVKTKITVQQKLKIQNLIITLHNTKQKTVVTFLN